VLAREDLSVGARLEVSRQSAFGQRDVAAARRCTGEGVQGSRCAGLDGWIMKGPVVGSVDRVPGNPRGDDASSAGNTGRGPETLGSGRKRHGAPRRGGDRLQHDAVAFGQPLQRRQLLGVGVGVQLERQSNVGEPNRDALVDGESASEV
jgi:hypothetical protein